jgi:hypothetical protein
MQGRYPRRLKCGIAEPGDRIDTLERRMTKAFTDNEGATEIVKLEGRWHALTIDHGWQGVAETALNVVSRFQPTTGGN